MPIYGTGTYRVKPEAIEKVKRAIEEFVLYIKENERGTEMYIVWQDKEDDSRFIHFYRFTDQDAEDVHSNSEAVKKFESIYTPELVGGPVIFTDYDPVAMKL